jgi:hypothetical protein
MVKTQVMGQPEQVAATLHSGSVVGTPTGFLTVSGSIVAYDSAGIEVGTGSSGLPPSFGVFDGVATRVISQQDGDIASTTAADDGNLLAPLAVELPGEGIGGKGVASFGGGRVVMGEVTASGVVARFLGSVPASVPTECWALPGTGGAAPVGGGGGDGGDGGSGAVGGAPLGGAPVGGAPVGGAPAGGAPVGGAPDGGAPVGGAPAGGAPLGGAPVGGAPAGGAPVGGEGAGASGAGNQGGDASTGGESADGDSGSTGSCECSAAPQRGSSGTFLLAVALAFIRRSRKRSGNA